MRFILDCSVAISWFLPDEDNARANSVYRSLRQDNQAIAPAIFWAEITNVLWVAERRQRISTKQADDSLLILLALPIHIDATPITDTITATLSLSRQYNLAAYDAAYLELALREGLLLATIDDRLTTVARSLDTLLEDPDVESFQD